MSKWRPSKECIYVIPDIHGNAYCLNQILKRITPLRDDDNVIFLGDYIDRGTESKQVLDQVIELHTNFPKQVGCLMGNHEWLMLASAGRIQYKQIPNQPSPYAVWMNNGGDYTLASYCNQPIEKIASKYKEELMPNISKDHLDFLERELLLYIETDDHIFVHAGCDPTKPLEEQAPDDILWNNSLLKYVQTNVGKAMPWTKTVVCGHSHIGPYLADKFMMIDASQTKKQFVIELNSMEAFFSEPGTTRMVQATLEEAKPTMKRGVVRRA